MQIEEGLRETGGGRKGGFCLHSLFRLARLAAALSCCTSAFVQGTRTDMAPPPAHADLLARNGVGRNNWVHVAMPRQHS